MATKTDLQIIALTHRGMERDHNEDYHGYIPDLESGEWVFFDSREVKGLSEKGSLLIVADGMGGTNAGEVASKIAVESVKTFIQQQIAQAMPDKEGAVKSILIESVIAAQKDLIDHEKQFPETEGMGTTLVVAWVIKNKAFITWVGDSRLYLQNKSGLKQLSHDHSYVQELVDAGKITAEQAFYHPQSNIITQSLGEAKRPPNPGYTTYNIQSDDVILICSDGLNGMLTDSNIELFMRNNPIAADAAKVLIDEANKAGGNDNITVLLAHVTNVDSPLPPEPRPAATHGKQAAASNDAVSAPVPRQKKNAMRGKILLLAVIVVLIGILAWQNRTTIIGLFTGDKANSTKKGDSVIQKVKPIPKENNAKPNNSDAREKTPEADEKDAKAEKKQANTGNSLSKPSVVKAKAENTTEKYKPTLDALLKVKNGYKPPKEDKLSIAFKNELGKCINKAKAATLTSDDIKTLYKAKNALQGYDGTGISELNEAVKELFKFLPDINPK
ncbi:MAG: PP2C family serine/threonine-protein phosphatase [Bacteroidota bacterium]